MKAASLLSWNYVSSLLIFWVFLSCFALHSSAQSQPQKPDSLNFSQKEQPQIIGKGKSGKRYFGDLMVSYTLDSTGTNMRCSLYLVTQFVYICNLNAASPDCNFDVELGLGKSSGRLSVNLANPAPHSISTLAGNFIYSVSKNHTSYQFKGDLTSWFWK